ncbi:hypothetical protein J1N35_040881 [Gossypium stocksii]|uniref:Uncharacterized protein n=1 Tax=Gossypium stocksii TaxID=47602 RepID=A0A9D3UEY2_9ROSI|nr:hypothetical protein J1N35_040881 [Gossypium stocksii]
MASVGRSFNHEYCGEEGRPVASFSGLYEFLGPSSRFADWGRFGGTGMFVQYDTALVTRGIMRYMRIRVKINVRMPLKRKKKLALGQNREGTQSKREVSVGSRWLKKDSPDGSQGGDNSLGMDVDRHNEGRNFGDTQTINSYLNSWVEMEL